MTTKYKVFAKWAPVFNGQGYFGPFESRENAAKFAIELAKKLSPIVCRIEQDDSEDNED